MQLSEISSFPLIPPIDSTRAIDYGLKVRRKNRTVLCCIVYDSCATCAQCYVHTHMSTVLKFACWLGFWCLFVYFVHV